MVVPVRVRVWQYWRTINEKGVQVMKLVEILARELKEWPRHGTEYIVQDSDGTCWPGAGSANYISSGAGWSTCESFGDFNLLTLATDHATAIVTRDMWEAERLSLDLERTDKGVQIATQQETSAEGPKPDWSKAPEGATHWGPRTGAYYEAWYKISDSGVPLCYVGDNEGWTQTGNFGMRPGLSPRPTTPQWTGEGLPPAGTVCEVFCHDHDAWIKCKTLDAVTGSREMACATIAGEGHYAQVFWGYKFRPIDTRTPRDKWIEAAERTLEENTSLIASSFQLGILFDAGLAKLPEDGE